MQQKWFVCNNLEIAFICSSLGLGNKIWIGKPFIDKVFHFKNPRLSFKFLALVSFEITWCRFFLVGFSSFLLSDYTSLPIFTPWPVFTSKSIFTQAPMIWLRYFETSLFHIQKQLPWDVLQKKVFLEISQNSKQNTCARDYFLIKLQACFCTLSQELW